MAALPALSALQGAGTALTVRDEVRPADAVVVTYGAMMTPSGPEEVERLYRARMAPAVVLSDFRIPRRGWGADRLQEITRRRLLRAGLPESSLVALATPPASEQEEAVALARQLRERGTSSAILVVRDYRALRTMGALRQALDEEPVALMADPVPARGVSLARWWQTSEGVSAVAGEWPRVAYYRLLGRI